MKEFYQDFEIKPYISPDRDLSTESFVPVARRNMALLEDDLLAGDIILLWRIDFGTFNNKSWFPKYFEYSYGIDAPRNLQKLIEKSYVKMDNSMESLKHITSKDKKEILKDKGIKGYSKLNSKELDKVIIDKLNLADLDNYFTIRGYSLTNKGNTILKKYQSIVDRHPKKNI